MLGRIYAIALNTFREAVRDRVLYGVVACATAVLFFTLALGQLSLNQEERVVADIGLASISLFSVMVAVFLGSSLLYKEIERKTLYVILPKPIHREEFLLGKFFGIALTGIVFVAIMGTIQLWVMALQAGAPVTTVGVLALLTVTAALVGAYFAPDRTAIVPPWSLLAFVAAFVVASRTDAELAPVLAYLALTVGELVVLTALALFFSSFSTPFLTGLLSIGVWLVGRSADAMIRMPGRTLPVEVKKLLAAIAWVVPNFDLFVPGRHTLLVGSTDYGGPTTYVATSLGYAVFYSAVLLVVASLVLRRRDFV
ncbi:MAG: ABC transporter permease subunit [Polyangiales bacterium]